MRRKIGPVLGLLFFLLIAVAVGIVTFTVPGGFSKVFNGVGPAHHIPFNLADVPMQPDKTLSMEAGVGHIKLKTDATRTTLAVSGTKVVQDEDDFNKINLQPKTEADGSLTLQVIKSCDNCYIDVEITAPPNIATILHTGSGNIEVDGVNNTSGLNGFSSGSGNIKLSNVTASLLDVQAGSGNITLDGVVVKSKITTHTGSGNITFNGDITPADSSLLEAGSGNINLKLNAQDYSKMALTANTSSGDIRNLANLTNVSNGAKHTLSANNGNPILLLHTGSGNITIEQS